MAYGGGLAFTKAAKSDQDGANGVNVSTAPRGTGQSMRMAALHDEYDDEMDDEEHNMDTEEFEPERTSMSLPVWMNAPKSSHMQKYGIGAKLMMKMGYEEGKGLGVKNEGIVEPIESKLLPKGLGVGAVSSPRPNKEVDVDSSEDEKDLVPEVSLYDIIQELRSKGIEVPTKYKVLSDNKNKSDTEELSQAFAKLNRISQEWTEADSSEKLLNYQIQSSTETIGKHLKTLESATELEILMSSEDFSSLLDLSDPLLLINATTNVLTQLSCDKYRNFSSITDVFASVVQQNLPELFKDDFETLSNENSLLMTTLSSWSLLYRNLYLNSSRGLDPFDSVIYSALETKLTEFISSKTADEEHVLDLLNIVQTWLHSPIFVNAELCLQSKLTREVIVPFFNANVQKWSPGKRFAFSPTFIIEFILLLSPDEASEFEEPLKLIEQKYKAFIDIQIEDSLWASKEDGAVRTELDTLKDVWYKVFDQYLGSVEVRIINEKLIYSIIDFLSSWTIGDEDKLTKIIQIFQAGLLDRASVITVLQFQVFNPWVMALKSLSEIKKLNVQLFFTQWFGFWTRSMMKDDPLVIWYLNAALYLIETGGLPKLPTLSGSTIPTLTDITKFIKNKAIDKSATVDVNGVPSYKLNTSFKEVVSAYCTAHGFLFSPTHEFHPTLGHSLFRIQLANFKAWSFIHEDVLWICRSADGEYTPISLDQLE